MLGLLGALDPYKHKMNVGAIKIQEDTGVAVISITESKNDELTAGKLSSHCFSLRLSPLAVHINSIPQAMSVTSEQQCRAINLP